MSKIIGEIEKNSIEKIIFSLGEFKGKQRVDIRTHFLPDSEEPDGWKPTKKGINFSLEQWEEFKDLVEKTNKILEEQV